MCLLSLDFACVDFHMYLRLDILLLFLPLFQDSVLLPCDQAPVVSIFPELVCWKDFPQSFLFDLLCFSFSIFQLVCLCVEFFFCILHHLITFSCYSTNYIQLITPSCLCSQVLLFLLDFFEHTINYYSQSPVWDFI